MTEILIFVTGLLIVFVGSAGILGLVLLISHPRVVRVSSTWLGEHTALEVRAVGRFEYQLVQGDHVIARSESEDALRAARTEIEAARGRADS